jgi:16S rRNA processing protein RimM
VKGAKSISEFRLVSADWAAMAVVGRIARTHGLRGRVIVDTETDFPEARFQPGGEVFIERNGVVDSLRLATVRFQRDRPVIGFEGVDTIDQAEDLAGREMRVPIERLMALPSDTFYQHELIGCVVETGRGQAIGVVNGVEGTLGTSRLVVDGPRGEVLIPLAAEICTTIDIAAKRIVVDAPDGLLDLNV